MSGVSTMKATQGDKRVNTSAAVQNFAADRCTGCPSSCPGGAYIQAASAGSPFFPNGTIRCGSCASRTKVGVANYLALESMGRPDARENPSAATGRHVKYGNW